MDKKIEDFMLKTGLQIQQLQGQVDAQQLVIAWLLNRLDRFEEGPSPSLNFLLHQSLALPEGRNSEEFLAVFDALAEDCVRFASVERNQS